MKQAVFGPGADLAALAALMLCPQCASGPLAVAPLTSGRGQWAAALQCSSCHTEFPAVGGVPCAVANPVRQLGLWREHLGSFHHRADQAIAALEGQRSLPGILPLTQRRLSEQIRLTHLVLHEVDDLLASAIGTPRPPTTNIPGFESRESLRSLHRDWGWPTSDENERALNFVQQVFRAPLGRTLVLGAGACRLAYDLASADPTALFVAVDDDPLVLVPAARILRGETLSLTEIRPLSTELTRLSATLELRAPRGSTDRVFPLLANGLAPPFSTGTFDTVLTPWFIDVVPPDLRDFLGSLRRVLAPGGRWLHFGSLLYPPERPPACQFSREELLELARRAGFSIEAEVSGILPFSVSPLAAQERWEPCLAFWASVGKPPSDDPSAPPSWLVLPHLPVPNFERRGRPGLESPGFRRVFDLVDGQRSIHQIMAQLGAPSGTDFGQLKDALRQCLQDNHPACQKAGNFET